MTNYSRRSRNYALRKLAFFVLAPLVGVGHYTLNDQTETIRSDGIKLMTYNEVQTKGAFQLAEKEMMKTASYKDVSAVPDKPKV